MDYIVRQMQIEDVPQVNAIDRSAFPTQWPPPPFKRDLRSQLVRYLVVLDKNAPQVPIEVNENGAKLNLWKLISRISPISKKEHSFKSGETVRSKPSIVGYSSVWLMADEAHLTSIAVRDTYRRCGVGELLLISTIDLSIRLNARIVTLEVRSSNIVAQSLYEKYGFSNVGTRHGYYSDDREDAVIMSTDNIISDTYQMRFQELKQDYTKRWGEVDEVQFQSNVSP